MQTAARRSDVAQRCEHLGGVVEMLKDVVTHDGLESFVAQFSDRRRRVGREHSVEYRLSLNRGHGIQLYADEAFRTLRAQLPSDVARSAPYVKDAAERPRNARDHVGARMLEIVLGLPPERQDRRVHGRGP